MIRCAHVRAKAGILLGPFLLLVLLLALAFLAACGSDTPADTESDLPTSASSGENAAPQSLHLTQADNGGSFAIQAGGTFDIALEANPSTGYSWELNDPDPEASLLAQVGEPTFVSDNPSAAGAGGTLTFTFQAVDKGEMIVKFVYLAPGVDEAPTETFQIDLTVR
jgi:inhibitor of cysteine peptidase